MSVRIMPDWDPNKAFDLRNHFERILKNNPKIICDKCGKRHFPDEETFIVIYGNITVGLRGGIIGNHFTEDGKLARASIYCCNKKCLGFLKEKILNEDIEDTDEFEEEDPEEANLEYAEDNFEDEDNLRNCTEIG